ncbi:MAG: PrsW family intramembrane metalloprotease [Candidatus Latescibacteria bacterium]|nr:PrsW family intramembrane metalloprotease [Candidatus Latescibacterota bacterium]NIO29091.1 PrsW family intramembrane metalloprotease [Candidatus Latescibacterota bacterium]NIO56716.1 PrsW family intramembrane metalloprotease [Candidatus Latescibacterota bacterium]NIT02299.1 PrsW family intramembrane metalloprotease [Candidatus Latescibacterota bacterium]NIT39184.1 PrsW family intramembrane metalloprotease [Candidatus Latescibacterota bacterium]
MINFLVKVIISALPVIAFLIALIFLDSYKLVRLRSVLLTILIGFFVALACLFLNDGLRAVLGWKVAVYSRYAAPIVEEVVKASYIVYLIRSKRLGFMVDAVIMGFALGAGFAIFENIYKLTTITDSNFFLWIIRGFGTAVMHGAATAIFALVSKGLSERHETEGTWVYLPGIGLVAAIHSLFNHFFISPASSAAALTIGFPLVMIAAFQQSERATRKWLGMGFDTDAELLEMIITGDITQTRLGQYLLSLKQRFSGEVVADMLCLLRIHLELSIKAKGTLLIREAGFPVSEDPAVKEKFEELRYLEKSIGTTGRLAIVPFLRWSSRDLWQLHMLGGK